MLNSTSLGIVDHVILFKSNWYKLTTSGDSTSSQFQHLGNRNTFWRHRLMHNRFLRTGNRVCSSRNFSVEHTVLILSLSGASLSHRTILYYVWPGSTCTRTITDGPFIWVPDLGPGSGTCLIWEQDDFSNAMFLKFNIKNVKVKHVRDGKCKCFKAKG